MPVSFFSRTTAKGVWRSVTGVSAAGSRRGRGKGTGRAIVKDFNRGQQIGEGKQKLVLAGLNTQVTSARKYVDLQDLGQNPEFEEKIKQVRKEMEVYRKFREAPLERGWSGHRSHGKSAGKPDDYNETSFDDFDSTVLMLRPIPTMTSTFGRSRIMQALVAVGNQNGLAGFGMAKGKDSRATVRHARNVAAQHLIQVPLWENHTVLHDFHSKYYSTVVYVQRKPRGYGLNCNRIIKAICGLFGITDLYARVDGVKSNDINLTKALFLGLMNQRQYQDIADEKKLHLVELREENFLYPQVLASPKDCRVLEDSEIKVDDRNLDFTYYINEGRIPQPKAVFRQPWIDGPTWYKHLDKVDMYKHREKVKLELAAKYGDTEVTQVFPYFRSNAKVFNQPKDQN